MSRRILLLWVVCASSVAQSAAAQAPNTNSTVALVHATALLGDGEQLENATIVLRNGTIASIAAGGAAPSGATVVDASGKVVTPGLIGVETGLGIVEVNQEETTDEQDVGDDDDPVRAAFSAADTYNPASVLVPIARVGGVTSALSTPGGGLVSGTSAWVDLGADTTEPVSSGTALHVDLTGAGIETVGGARPHAMLRLRELFDDARLYAQNRSAFDRRALREMHVSRLDLERVSEALAGRIPVVIRVSRAADIARVVALGQEYHLRLVLSGVEEGWKVADVIARAHVPVIVQPLTNLPSNFETLASRYDNATLLSRAGVRLIFSVTASTGVGEHDLHNLKQEAGNAIASGVDPAVALAAITSEPARVFGQEGHYGVLRVGAVANVVVWSGDPFETSTLAEHVYVRGVEQTMRTRQSDLFDRYRDLTRVRQGYRNLGAEVVRRR